MVFYPLHKVRVGGPSSIGVVTGLWNIGHNFTELGKYIVFNSNPVY